MHAVEGMRRPRTAIATTTATVCAKSPHHDDDDNLDLDVDSGLEYHIKFPSSSFHYGTPTLPTSSGSSTASSHSSAKSDDYVFVVDEERLPVVLLFGWAGCQDKYLAKYSRIYEDKGLITLRYIVPIRYLMWKRYHVVLIGEQLVQLLQDLHFDGHPIIVHCFSNGGAFLYQNFSLALGNCPKNIEVKGVIFDSGPGSRRLLSLYKAISAIVGGNAFYNAAMSMVFTFFCSMIWLSELIQRFIYGPDRYLVADPFDRLQDEPYSWPQHFIYSEADELIAHKDVEEFIKHRELRGVRVSALRYARSPHVKHFSENKESYEASVIAFVNECLRDGGGGGGGGDVDDDKYGRQRRGDADDAGDTTSLLI